MTNEQALEWLSQDEIHHMDMLEALRHRAADIISSTANGLLVCVEGVFLLSTDSKDDALQLLAQAGDLSLLSIHHESLLPAIQEAYPLTVDIACYPSVYQSNNPLPLPDSSVSIRPLGAQHFEFVKRYYHTGLDDDCLAERLQSGMLFGAYIEHDLAGFIGVHAEGSIGLLEVLPSFRRRGIASALQTFMTNQFLQNGLVPFGQVAIDNQESFALQQKLGYTIGQKKIIWLSRTQA